MDPGTLAAIALTSSAVGTGMSVYSAYQQGKAREAQAKYNAQVQRNQAEAMRRDAVENRGRMRDDAQRRLARLKAIYAGSGLAVDDGTPAAMYGDTAGRLELAVADYATKIERKAQALQQGALLDDWQGKQARRAGTLNAIGEGISGLGSLASGGFNFHDKLKATNAATA